MFPVEAFVAATNFVVIFAVFAGLWWARRAYLAEQSRTFEKITFLERYRQDHEKWSGERSYVVDQLVLSNQRLNTLIEVMDKRVVRLEDHEMSRSSQRDRQEDKR